MNFSGVNIHIDKIFFVFTYDGGNTWFETQMVKRGDDYDLNLPNVPDQGTLIYFLKTIDMFGEEFIDNNSDQYYHIELMNQSLQSHSGNVSETLKPNFVDMDDLDDALESDMGLSLDSSDMDSMMESPSYNDEDSDDDETELVENTIENDLNVDLDDDDKTNADDEVDEDETPDQNIDEIEDDEDGSESLDSGSDNDGSEIDSNEFSEDEEKDDLNEIKDNSPQKRINSYPVIENYNMIKPIKPKAPIDKDSVPKLKNLNEVPGAESIPLKKEEGSDNNQSPTPGVDSKGKVDIGSIFSKGAKKKKKFGKKEEENEAEAESSEVPPIQSKEEENEPPLSKDEQDLMTKILALSRGRVKQEQLEKEAEQAQVSLSNGTENKQFSKKKVDLSKADKKKNIKVDAQASAEASLKQTIDFFMPPSNPIIVSHPFSEMMKIQITQNGSLLVNPEPNAKKKPIKSDKRNCKSCEAVIFKNWKVCPICGTKQ